MVDELNKQLNDGLLEKRRELAENLLGAIEWETDTTGYCECPNIESHSTANGRRDCRVTVDGAPTIYCLHAHCQKRMEELSQELRKHIFAGEGRKRKRSEQPESEDLDFGAPIEPWGEPVDGQELLDDIIRVFSQHIVMPNFAYVAVGIWNLWTYGFEAFTVAPILQITSPERQCGKSLLMEILEALVHRPLLVCGVSAAALFRAIEAYRPTVLVDEFDSTDAELKEAIRQVLNSGFKKTGKVLRCVGENHNLKTFTTFAPKAIAGIGDLPDTVASRSIRIALSRKLQNETVESFRHFDGTEIRRKCVRWWKDNLDKLKNARPDFPVELKGDRERDGWEPLLAIADLCGDWGGYARQAAVALSKTDSTESLSAALLRDIRSAFRFDEQLTTEELLARLHGIVESPWPTLCDGKPIHAHRLAKMLARYAIAPGNIGAKRRKGYSAEWFEDAFSRYLPTEDQT